MSADLYSACAHTNRQKPDMTINKEIAEAIGNDFRILPLYEKGLYERKYINYYSLITNEYLRCRWREYCKNFENKVFTPFQFVDIRDFHFHNGNIRLQPSASCHNKKDFRFKMKPGVGVDSLGERPIPNEITMKSGKQVEHRPEPLRKRKGKDVAVQVYHKRDHFV